MNQTESQYKIFKVELNPSNKLLGKHIELIYIMPTKIINPSLFSLELTNVR